jgi:hypothetical protein
VNDILMATAQPTPVRAKSERAQVERHSSDYDVELPPELLDTQQRLGLVLIVLALELTLSGENTRRHKNTDEL